MEEQLTNLKNLNQNHQAKIDQLNCKQREKAAYIMGLLFQRHYV